jgi:tagatose 1,6-diphosphate aldolase
MRIISTQTAQKLCKLATENGVFLGAENGKTGQKVSFVTATVKNPKGSVFEYDSYRFGQMPALATNWSVHRIVREGSLGVLFKLYYDPDAPWQSQEKIQALIERVGLEADAAQLPFFLQLVSYDRHSTDKRSLAFAKMMPHKVLLGIKEFIKPQYRVDVLIVEQPFNQASLAKLDMRQAKELLRQLAQATKIPYLLAGADLNGHEMAQVMTCVKKAKIDYNGIYCQNDQDPDQLAQYLQNAQPWEERLVVSDR